MPRALACTGGPAALRRAAVEHEPHRVARREDEPRRRKAVAHPARGARNRHRIEQDMPVV